jgi:hypothetical protein
MVMPPQSSGGMTPQAPARNVPAAPDSTKAPVPAHNPGHPALNMTTHTATPSVQGPSAWENGRDPVFTPHGKPPQKFPGGGGMRPDYDSVQPTKTAGVNPDPPANRQRSVPDDPSLPAGLNAPLGWQPFNTGQ